MSNIDATTSKSQNTVLSIVYAVLIAMAAFAAYHRASSIPFLYDDNDIILRPGAFESNNFARDLFSKKYFDRFGERTYRPVATASFYIDKQLWGLSSKGCHVFNVAIHAAISVIVFLILSQLGLSPFAAFFGAIIFALHPVKTEAVALASNREELLCALFFFAALACRLRGGFAAGAASIVFFAAAMFSKEMAASLPMILVALEVWLVHGKKEKPASMVSAILRVAPYLIVTAIFIALKYSAFSNPVGIARLPGESVPAAVMIMSEAFLKYCELLVYPVSQCADYVIAAPSGVFPALGFFFFVCFSLCVWKLDKLIGFALAFFLISMLPVSNIVPFGEVMADRYLYIPSFALSLIAARATGAFPARRAGVLVAAIIAFVLFSLTLARLEVWQSEEKYWTAATVCEPESFEAWTNLGNVFLKRNRPDIALGHYKRAAESKGFINEEKFFYNLGLALMALRRPAEAENAFLQSVEFSIKPVAPYYQLSKIEAMKGRPQNGLAYLEKAISNGPDIALSRYIATMYILNNFTAPDKIALAATHIKMAQELEPDNPLYLAALGKAHIAEGKTSAAVAVLRRCLEISPDYPQAVMLLQEIHGETKTIEQ